MSAPTHGAWGSAHAVGYHAPATAGDAYGEHPAVAFSHDFDSGAGAEPESLAPVPLSWADVFSATRARVLRRDGQASVHCEDSGEPQPRGAHRPAAAARVKVWQQFDDSTVAPVFTVMQPGIGVPSVWSVPAERHGSERQHVHRGSCCLREQLDAGSPAHADRVRRRIQVCR